MLNIFKNASNTNEILDIQNIFARCTLDSIGEIAFGYDIGCLKDESVPFSNAFNLLQNCVAERFYNPLYEIWPLLVPSERKIAPSLRVIDDFAFDLIAKRKKQDLSERTDLLSQYMKLEDENNQPFSDEYLRDVIVNLLVAGRDTTASTLTFCFYLLSQSPRVEAKLLQEINETLHGDEPNYDNIKDMKYLHAVIEETLRIYPPVSYDPKCAIQDDVLPNGTRISKGTVVYWSAFMSGKSSLLWDEPYEFRPERWLGENGSIPVEAINAIPFQAGPRVCLGKAMAYLEIKLFLILLLQEFHFELAKNFVLQFERSIVLSVRNGMKMGICRRK